MAGIGFRLREMSARKSFAEWLKLYVYSTVIFSGPWLISILALGALSLFALESMEDYSVRVFTVTIVYTYCFSLITTGLLQLVVTRYVSDQLFMRNPDAVVPCFVGAMAVTVIVQTVTGALVYYSSDLAFYYKITGLGLYVTVSVIWIEMLFLSAAKDYGNTVLFFAIGYLASFLGGQSLGMVFKLDGLLIGFLIGQVVLMVLLMYRIFTEYRFGLGVDFGFLGHFRRYPSLALAGMAYNTAIWIDKIIFWYSPSGLHIHSFFYTHFPYDSAMFLAFVTVVPAVAIFLLRIETDFYICYKNYYGAILQKAPYDVILEHKKRMLAVLKAATKNVLIYQGCFTLGVLLVMPFLVSLLGIDPENTPIFRVAALGAFFHVCLLSVMILLLYFDFRGSALAASLVFLATNAGLSVATTSLPTWTYGWGYTLSCLVTLLFALVVFFDRFRKLEYLTFMRQPLR
jgi:uncharacterized membrane protein